MVSRSQTTPDPSRIVDREAARCTGSCGRSTSAVPFWLSAASVRGRRLGVHEQEAVERDAELRRQRVQRVDRRLRAPGLDLADQAGRDADDLGQPAQAQPAGEPRRRAGGRPCRAYSGSAAPVRRSRPTPFSLAGPVGAILLVASVTARLRPLVGCVALVNAAINRQPPRHPGRIRCDDVRLARCDDRRLGGTGQPRPPPHVPLRPRQGRARGVRPRRDAAVRLQQHPLRHEHPHRRVGARQDDALRAPDPRRDAPHLGLRVGGQAPPAQLPVAAPRRTSTPGWSACAAPWRPTPACSGGPPARSASSCGPRACWTCRSASTSSSPR